MVVATSVPARPSRTCVTASPGFVFSVSREGGGGASPSGGAATRASTTSSSATSAVTVFSPSLDSW